MRCIVQTHLNSQAEKVWAAAKQSATLIFVTHGLLGFSGAEKMPPEWYPGAVFQTRFWFFHILPAWWKHRLEVTQVDENRKQITSHECGGMIRVWNHTIQIEPSSEGCNYCDELEIEAGWLTPVVWLYANLFYRYRQARWQQLSKRIDGRTAYHKYFL